MREKQLKSLSPAWTLWIVLTIAQTILSFLLYNPAGLRPLRIVGWIIWAFSCVFGWLPIIILRSKGGVPKGKSYTRAMVLVDSGIYAVVRHPQYLGFILLNLFFILVAQHWLITVLGIAAMPLVYFGIIPGADRANVEKFGDGYRQYMDRVPRANFVAGIIRLARRRKGE